jgi:hypothetical protein
MKRSFPHPSDEDQSETKENMRTDNGQDPRGKSRIPKNSIFYQKVIPIALIIMTVIMAILILMAVGILMDLVPYR